MIRVRLFGHIKTSVGSEELELDEEVIEVASLVDRVRALSTDKEPGFNRYNTLVLVQDSEAFVPGSASRRIKSGDEVALIPFSHGG